MLRAPPPAAPAGRLRSPWHPPVVAYNGVKYLLRRSISQIGRSALDTHTAESPSERRRLQQREETQRTILDATEALLLEDGSEGFSMRRLAARCGFTAPTIYHYFGDKRGLIDALLEERFRSLLDRIRRVRRREDRLETLRAYMQAFVRFGLQNPTFYRLLTVARTEESPPPESSEKVRALMETVLAEFADEGRLVTEDLELALQHIWATLHGLISLRIHRPDYDWSKTLDEFAIDTMLRGLVRPASADSARPWSPS